MRIFLTCLLLLTAVLMAAPENNPVLQPSTWNGYGVDWMYRSLRIGVANKDSLLEDGWLFADSIIAAYASFGAASFTSLTADTIIADSLLRGLNLRVLDDVVIDSTLTVGDSTYLNDELTVAGLAVFNSTVTLTDTLSGINAILSGPLSADSIEADHWTGVNAAL